ncbi:MAG: phosphotransferase [Muribaculum sp.]|nr:phosphotransferase [Muribaculum sp.]
MTDSDVLSALRSLFVDYYHLKPDDAVEIVRLPQGGGDRQYFRMTSSSGKCVGTYDPDASEAKCFVNLARNFYGADLEVPQIYSFSDDYHFYLQEDLGDVSLFSVLGQRFADINVLMTVLRLADLQCSPKSLWENDVIHPEFSCRQILWDLNYFKYDFLKPSGIPFDENKLENDFERLCVYLLSIPKKFWGFMMRDCQSRNVMMHKTPHFIDFQGGRFGPCLYDAVSLLWQARAGFSDEFRMRMLVMYALQFCGDKDEACRMLADLNNLVIFRTLQVLGAYGFRGLIQHRSHFILSIPGAVENLRQLIGEDALDEFPELKSICLKLIENPKYSVQHKSDALRVEVFSFSYKKGYPEDLSGNGGGFMFDCRAMHNPGRYEQFKALTGRDAPVIEFLESRGEVQSFLANAWSLTDPAVERYLSRGFTNLQIGFGCTGGQHRSVYCAEATASHLRTLFPEATVILTHREHPVITHS